MLTEIETVTEIAARLGPAAQDPGAAVCRGMGLDLRNPAEFAEVVEDPEFAAAVVRP